MASVEEQTVHAGHTIFIRVGNTVVGKAQGLDGERSFGTEGVYEIGSMMPQEHITNRYEGSFSLERFFARKDDLAKLGYGSLGEEVLKKSVFNFEVVDKLTKKVLRVYYGCTIVTYRETFRVNAIAGESATFTYLYAKSGDSVSG